MALPLPKVIPDVGPGGGLVTAMGGMNSLANDMLLRKINGIKAQYAPLTAQAEAASKLAYANLMGPQFLAKLMGNPGFLGNTNSEKLQQLREKVTNAGMGGGTGENLLNQMQAAQQRPGERAGNSLSNFLQNKIFGAFSGGQSQSNPMAQDAMTTPQSNVNALTQPTEQSTPNGQVKRPKDGTFLVGEQWYNKKGEPVYAEEVDAVGKPTINLELTKGQHAPRQKTYAENTGDYLGTVKEGEERGKIRATSMKELDQDYQQALQLKQPIDLLGKIISNPRFQNLRKIPGFQKLQMNGKIAIGTPEEKKLIGEFQAAARQVVSATVKGFGGRILASEIPLSESMKLSDSDSIESMLGKEPVIKAFNEMTLKRSRIASQLMKDYHLDKGEALEQADKMVDGEAIRRKAEMELNPITDEDIDYTAQQTGMTREQVIQRLSAEGRYNG